MSQESFDDLIKSLKRDTTSEMINRVSLADIIKAKNNNGHLWSFGPIEAGIANSGITIKYTIESRLAPTETFINTIGALSVLDIGTLQILKSMINTAIESKGEIDEDDEEFDLENILFNEIPQTYKEIQLKQDYIKELPQSIEAGCKEFNIDFDTMKKAIIDGENPLYKTHLCNWTYQNNDGVSKNECTKGDKCTYAHNENEKNWVYHMKIWSDKESQSKKIINTQED